MEQKTKFEVVWDNFDGVEYTGIRRITGTGRNIKVKSLQMVCVLLTEAEYAAAETIFKAYNELQTLLEERRVK